MNVRQVVPRDAIPSVDDPGYHDPDEYDGDPDDEVIVVDGWADGPDGRPRAFPIRYLNYHEIVNAAFGGHPIAVTWCPLCGSAVVYDRRVETADGRRTLEFGVSGKLADDDLVMYDRETESEWKQSLGEAIAGPLEGTDLRVLPASVTTVRRFRADYDGELLAPPGGESEASGPGDDPEPIEYGDDPYREYFDSDGFGLGAHRDGGDGREWDRDDVDPKAVVLGLEIDGDALGVPLERVEDAGGAVTATVGGRDVVVFATPDGIHAFAHPGYDFAPTDEGRFRADGTNWDGATGESADGRRLERLPARRLFAFAWQDDHGPDAFYRA